MTSTVAPALRLCFPWSQFTVSLSWKFVKVCSFGLVVLPPHGESPVTATAPMPRVMSVKVWRGSTAPGSA